MTLGFKRSLIVGLAVLILAAILAPVALAANPGTTVVVMGNVEGVYYAGPRELGGAAVSIVDPANPTGPPLFSTTTNESGMFIMSTFLDLPTYVATWAINGSKAGFATDGTTFAYTVPPGAVIGSAPAIEIHLVVNNTTVSGKVKNAATGKGLKGVKVKLGNKTATTSTSGKYKVVIGLWPGSKYKIKFSKKGFHTATKIITSNPGGTKTLNVSLRR
jgi:hypothetical protein